MLHGDMRQAIRLKVLRKLKRGELQVLVATDVAARGIDVSGLGMVVNFDLPDTVEAYVHRIGRTGRAGQVGAALSICSVADQEKLAAVLSRVGQRMTVIDSDGSVIEDFRPERVPSKRRDRGRARPRSRRFDGTRSGRKSSITLPSLSITVIRCPTRDRTAASFSWSATLQIDSAAPTCPARPVRPIRWT